MIRVVEGIGTTLQYSFSPTGQHAYGACMKGEIRAMIGVEPERPGRLVLLNGSPSSGKTTSAQAVQAVSKAPVYHRSLDDFRRGYLPGFWQQDRGGVLFRRTLDAYLMSLRNLVLLGHDVVSEAVIIPNLLPHYLALFEGTPVLFIGIRCPPNEVQRRERERNDRHSAAVLDEPVHAHGCYDLEVDTSLDTPEEIARRIMALIVNPPEVTAFDRLRERHSKQYSGRL
jgi:chloramphenicol 3-O phosphotransferase